MKPLLIFLSICLLAASVAMQSAGQALAVNPVRDTAPREKDSGPVLKANYPNPFHDQTTIGLYMPRAQTVKITLYNVVGAKISTLLDEQLAAGDHDLLFKRPEGLPDGIYIYTVQSGNTSRSMRMIIR